MIPKPPPGVESNVSPKHFLFLSPFLVSGQLLVQWISIFFKYCCNVWRGTLYILEAWTWLQSPLLTEITARDISSEPHFRRRRNLAFEVWFICNEFAEIFTNFYFVGETICKNNSPMLKKYVGNTRRVLYNNILLHNDLRIANIVSHCFCL
jgi:hypothetical protein